MKEKLTVQPTILCEQGKIMSLNAMRRQRDVFRLEELRADGEKRHQVGSDYLPKSQKRSAWSVPSGSTAS